MKEDVSTVRAERTSAHTSVDREEAAPGSFLEGLSAPVWPARRRRWKRPLLPSSLLAAAEQQWQIGPERGRMKHPLFQ
jgi:hypothetical protein